LLLGKHIAYLLEFGLKLLHAVVMAVDIVGVGTHGHQLVNNGAFALVIAHALCFLLHTVFGFTGLYGVEEGFEFFLKWVNYCFQLQLFAFGLSFGSQGLQLIVVKLIELLFQFRHGVIVYFGNILCVGNSAQQGKQFVFCCGCRGVGNGFGNFHSGCFVDEGAVCGSGFKLFSRLVLQFHNFYIIS